MMQGCPIINIYDKYRQVSRRICSLYMKYMRMNGQSDLWIWWISPLSNAAWALNSGWGFQEASLYLLQHPSFAGDTSLFGCWWWIPTSLWTPTSLCSFQDERGVLIYNLASLGRDIQFISSLLNIFPTIQKAPPLRYLTQFHISNMSNSAEGQGQHPKSSQSDGSQ